jgi:hypothetical protein
MSGDAERIGGGESDARLTVIDGEDRVHGRGGQSSSSGSSATTFLMLSA